MCRRSVGFADDPVQLSGLQLLHHQAAAEEQSGQVTATFNHAFPPLHVHQNFVLRVEVQEQTCSSCLASGRL